MAFRGVDRTTSLPTVRSALQDIKEFDRRRTGGFTTTGSSWRNAVYLPDEDFERLAQGHRPQTPESWDEYSHSDIDSDSELDVVSPIKPNLGPVSNLTLPLSTSILDPFVPSRISLQRDADIDSGTSFVAQQVRLISERDPECIVCSAAVPSYTSFIAPCGHHYCRVCLESYVTMSIQNESSFPPHCCSKPFPLGLEPDEPSSSRLFLSKSFSVSSVLSNPELIRHLDAKSRELSVPPKDRLYCPNPQCSVFLGSLTTLRTEARPAPIPCCSCGTTACLQCKGASHSGSKCPSSPEEAAEKQVRKLAKDEKWQTCPQCKEIVERTEGCPHMVCRCKAEFCYGCGSKWNDGMGCICRSRSAIPLVRTWEDGLEVGIIPSINATVHRVARRIRRWIRRHRYGNRQ
ncbi:hypothetical protein K435DRAFT_760900 [Dendrothele bispora CBS 962.96]|uniref:RBR-type E3 ubiquitin transferase n=1 Tax=Dendrothele bispora (strain CBS 962.96) TaxID=1314807 RepID=A0A4S8LK96_DENBC|nr:hypothetical protein K435DRAFT_760900 [Dendrothele bispora CBS 962.96]